MKGRISKLKTFLIFSFLLLSYQKTFAFELNVFDNLRFFFYSENMIYNKGIDLYNAGEYDKRNFYFDSVKCGTDKDFCAKKTYNAGNSNYRIGESKTDIDEKSLYFQDAIDDYIKSLSFIFDDETKQNLDFVTQKLNELKKQKEEEKKNENKEDNKEQEKKDDSDKNEEDKQNENSQENNSKQEETKEPEKEQKSQEQTQNEQTGSTGEEEPQIVKNGSMGLGGDASDNKGLSPDEEKQLNDYYSQLKNEEKQNQEFFNKKNNSKKEESPFDQFLSPFRFFQGDPFFDEMGGDDNSKDW